MKYNISFNFDSETKKLTNVIIEDVKSESETLSGSVIKVEASKVVLSKDAVKALGVKAGDKVSINYYTVNNELTFPIIGKDTTNGNKLTKSNSFSYRGEQRKILLEYGSMFTLEPFEGNFKMVPFSSPSTEESEIQAVAEAAGNLDLFANSINMNLEPEENLPI